MKAMEQYFHVEPIVMLCKVALTSECVAIQIKLTWSTSVVMFTYAARGGSKSVYAILL